MNSSVNGVGMAICVLIGSAASVFGQEIVWSGTQVVDRVVHFEHGQNLVLKPGTRVEFVGEGRIAIRDASFRAEGAELVATTTLTNNYRLSVSNGGLTMRGCRAFGVISHEPVKGYGYFIGSIYGQSGGGRLEDNVFVDCSPVAYLNASGVEVVRNLFVRPRTGGAYLFNVTGCRVANNEFFSSPDEALQLNGTYLTEVSENRFTDCTKGIRGAGMKSCRIAGNSFFGGALGIQLWWDGGKNIFLANLFEGQSGFALSGFDALGDGDIIANNLVVQCCHGFHFPKMPDARRLTVRNNGFAQVGIAIRLEGGVLEATNNAMWQSKYGMVAQNGAKLATPGLVEGDPRFRYPELRDWRLRKSSPWRRAGTEGCNVGLFQGGK